MISQCLCRQTTFTRINYRNISFFRRKKDEKQTEVIEESVIEEKPAGRWDHLTDQQIMEIRNKSNLTDRQREKHTSELNAIRRFDRLYEYKEGYVRSYYAKYGKQCGLKPGVLWPSKEKLEFMKKFEATFYPPLDKMMKDLAEEKANAAEAIRQREKEVAESLKKLPQLKKEFFARVREREELRKQERQKKEKLVQDIREYLGYNIDPKDSRFQDAVLKKEEEDKLKAKSVKKESKQQKLLAKLAAMAADSEMPSQESKQTEQSPKEKQES